MELIVHSIVADLFPFCYERDFMKSFTKEKRDDMIDAFNSTSRYLDDLLNIDNNHFEWFTEYMPLNFNLTELLLLIP